MRALSGTCSVLKVPCYTDSPLYPWHFRKASSNSKHASRAPNLRTIVSARHPKRPRNSSDQLPIAQRTITKLVELPVIPIGSYISSHSSIIHRLDPRLKQAWLAALLLFPPNGTSEEKLLVCLFLTLLIAVVLPSRSWRPQLTGVASIVASLFLLVFIGADGVLPAAHSREPNYSYEGLEYLQRLEGSYGYVLWHYGPVQITRKSVDLAIGASCLTFTILQTTFLILCTTTPEEMAKGVRWYLRPLSLVRVPTDEIAFSMLMSLRFTAIVFEEMRNLSLGLIARGIDWNSLGWRGITGLLGALTSRMIESLFNSSWAVSDAITSRGYLKATKLQSHMPEARDARDICMNLASILLLCAFAGFFEV